jgi:hypothetical protein
VQPAPSELRLRQADQGVMVEEPVVLAWTNALKLKC